MPYSQSGNKQYKPKRKIYDPSLGLPPTEKQIARLTTRAKNVCMYSLAKSDKTRKQLKDKLYLKDIPSDIIELVLDELEEKGYINDLKFAQNFVFYRKHNTPIKTLKNKLYQKGVPSEVTEEAVSELEEEDEYEKAQKLINTRTRSVARIPEDKRKQKMLTFMINKGFSYSVSQTVVTEFLENLEIEEND